VSCDRHRGYLLASCPACRAAQLPLSIGDRVTDGRGRLWTVLNAPCSIAGAESSGLFRREAPNGGQQYGEHIPGPLRRTR
jgi:hypothetical protein